jgi:hypothetical protein
MPATTTVKADVGGERYWRGYWTTMHLFEALFQMLDRETWAKFGIDVGEKSDPCDLWPAYIECGGVVVRLETEAQMEVYEAAQTQVARALMMIEPDRLKALAGELFAYSLPVLK